MAKLTTLEKEIYSGNMEIAQRDNITFAQSDNKKITVAIKPNDRMRGFNQVYVAYCGDETPKRKRGINAVMNRYLDCNYILVPIIAGMCIKDEAKYVLRFIENSYFK